MATRKKVSKKKIMNKIKKMMRRGGNTKKTLKKIKKMLKKNKVKNPKKIITEATNKTIENVTLKVSIDFNF